MADIKRRDFLKISAATAAMVAGAGELFANTGIISSQNSKENSSSAAYTQQMYREEFEFTYGEKTEHGFAFHCVNCQGNCSWEVWSNNGIVTRENQSSRYPSINSKIPDFNPRGCNKGVQHSQTMYEKDRILYPMKRAGKRGEGRWKRIGWDEAGEIVAQKIWDVMTDQKRGPKRLCVHTGTGLLSEGRRAASIRFSTQLGASRIYPASYLGDMFSGVAVAYGEGNLGCTYDFLFGVNTAIFWGANPSVSRIPDAHFVWEGKYNGAKIIVITPEFNASAKSADLWIPVKPGSDTLLSASVLHEIIQKKMYKENFMKIYTDLVFLVNTDTKKLLRRSDIEGDKEQSFKDEFYCMNKKEDKIALMPATKGSRYETLRISDFGIDPYLEGEWEVTLHNGKNIKVTTVFEMLKKNIAPFSPQETQKDTGVHPDVVRELASEIAASKVVEITAGFSLNKYFNGIMTLWNISSICGLTGRLGPYGGINTENEFALFGLEALSGFNGKYSPRFGSGMVGEFVFGDGMKTFDKYFNDEDIKRAQNGMSKEEYKKIVELLLDEGKDDKANLKEWEKGKKENIVKPHWSFDTAIIVADSRFRRNKGDEYKKAFLKKVKWWCCVDSRMSDAAVYADLLLPAKSHYEVYDIRSSPGYHRFTNLSYPPANLKPVGEAKDEWSMFAFLAKKLEEIANREGNIDKAKVKDDKKYARDGYRDLSNFYKEFINKDEESQKEMEPVLGTDKKAVEAALESCRQYEPWTIKKMYEAGGFLQLNEKAAKSSPLYSDRPYNSNEYHLFKFERFQTLSGRQTFYVDHDMYIKLNAQTNRGMKGIRADNKMYPFVLLTPHARWSIHSNYKNSKTLLRLQRGKPYVQINREVAKIKGIQDGDEIRVFNDIGEFYTMAKVSSSAPVDSLVMEHGWENYMYKENKGHNEVVPTAINLLELADGWGHLRFGALWDGNQYAYDVAVNFEKAKA